MSWVFHASEPWPIVIGQIDNSPPNLEACVCFKNKYRWCMKQFYKMHGNKYWKKKEIKLQKFKHIKYTKLSPIMSETVPSPVESPFCRTSKKSARHRLAILSLLCLIWIWLVRWSRHLVIYWRLLENRMYWSCQRFASKGLVVVREGISTPNAPYLR